MPTKASPYGYWSSDRIFILAAAGAVISLGNVWRLPFLMGTYGGSAFLFVYILACASIVLPVLVAEILIGRWSRSNLVDGSRQLTKASEAHRVWPVIGIMSLIGAVLVLSFYSVIAGWSMAYVFRAAGSGLMVHDLVEAEAIFLGLVSDPERSLAWHTLFMVTTTVCVAHGLKGIEQISRAVLPTAFLLMIAALIAVIFIGRLDQAAAFLFSPDWAALGWRGVCEALRQAYFSLSLGVGVMLAYGVYLQDQRSVMRASMAVISLDLVFAVVAGLAVYGLLFAASLVPAGGTSLVFELLPLASSTVKGGNWILVMIYLALGLITLVSAVALMEPVVVWLSERFAVSRVFATAFAAILIWFLGLGTLLSFNIAADLTLWGKTFFGWISLITSHILLPLVGLLICIFVSRLMPAELLVEAWGGKTGRGYQIWLWCLRYPARVGLIVVVLYTIGLFDWMVGFWQTPSGSAVEGVVTVIESGGVK